LPSEKAKDGVLEFITDVREARFSSLEYIARERPAPSGISIGHVNITAGTLGGLVRDKETGEIAIEAALTGHLMFSTLHTNDAVGTVIRFIDMGIQPFLVSSSLLGIVAQRLMRRLCTKCKEPYDPTEEEMQVVRAQEPLKLFKAAGCSRCGGTGYKGRIGVHELLRPNDEIKTMINKVVPTEELKKVAVNNGMIPLYEDAMNKVRQGISSLEEALRVVRED